MPISNNDQLSAELARSLESATSLMQDLLGDIKDNATSLAVLKAKIESLGSSVESLSNIVRDGNGKGSMVTRLALAEKSLEDIEEGFDSLKEELSDSIKEIKDSLTSHVEGDTKTTEDDKKFKRERALAKLKLVGIIAPGTVALAILIIKMILGESSTP